MPENEAGGLEGAETAAHRHCAIVGIGPGHKWKHLLEDVVLEGGVPADAVGRMTAPVVEGLSRQPLDAIKLQMPGIDLVGEARDDLELLVFPEPPVPRREHQHLRSGMAEDQELHVPLKSRTVPAPIISLHVAPKNRPTFSVRSACCSPLPG